MQSPDNNADEEGSEGTGLNYVFTEEVIEIVETKTPTFGFTEPSWRTDFCLVVEGTRLYVAKNILSLASPVFDTMFHSDFKEKSCDELELPGKKLGDVIEFLRCIYPDSSAEIDCDNALAILPLLEEYQVLQHKPRCETVLVESVTEETTTGELLQMLKQACTYELKTLRARCIFLMSSRPCDVVDESYCKSFTYASALNEIFLHANKSMKSELTSMKNKLAKLEQVTKENELFKKYISSVFYKKNFKDLKADPEKKWDDKCIVLVEAVPGENIESEGKVVEIWGIPFKIYTKQIGHTFYLGIRNMGQMKVICDTNAVCILVNWQPNGSNYLVNFKGNLNNWSQEERQKIADISSLEDYADVACGKVGMIIHLFVAQPNLKKR